MAAWQLKVLGPVSLTNLQQSFVPERRSAAVLSYLALEGPTPRSKLAGLLWPESLEATARNNLSQNLRRLRRTTAEGLIVGEDPLRLSPQLSVDAAELKVRAFSEAWQEVLALAAGELLSGLDYDDLPDFADWLYGEREDLRALERQALVTLTEGAQALGHYAEAITYAKRLVNLDPVVETAHRSLMRLYYLAGDRPAALKAYHRCKEVLARELGVEPLPETKDLARSIDRGTVAMRTEGAKEDRAIPLEVLRPPVLVGREREWAAMEEAWARGQAIYVTGEPGVGKTRLAQEFVASKGRGLYLPARPGHQEVPFATAVSLARTRIDEAPEVALPEWVRRELSRILPELQTGEAPPPWQGEEDRLRFFQAYLEMVRLTGAGFVATISDDAQYYDQATVELGGFMMSQRPSKRSGAIPRYVIVYRRGELPPASQAFIDRLVAAEVAARVDLAPLDARATTSLLASLNLGAFDDGVTPRLTETVYRGTGGNPLFILETLRNLIETDRLAGALPERLPVTSKVDAIVRQRLSRLSPAAQRLVQAAAVLQSDFDLELIGKVLDADPLSLVPVWEELERAQVFSGSHFSHDLLYEAVLASISQPVKALLNARSAAALLERQANPARIARHWLETGDDARALPALLAAARFLGQGLRFKEALHFYSQALLQQERRSDLGGAFDTLAEMLAVPEAFSNLPEHRAAVERLKGFAQTPEQRAKAAQEESRLLILLGPEGAEAAARGGSGEANRE